MASKSSHPKVVICHPFTQKHLWVSSLHKVHDVLYEGPLSQTTKVTLTESSPERSGYMHMDKQITQSILVMLCSMKGTEIAKVEGLWLVNAWGH